MRLDDVRGFVLDVDGTLVHRDGEEVHLLPGAREVLERIRASGRPLALFTNGSHIPPSGFAEDLRDAGLEVADDELLTPLTSVRTYLRAHHEATVLLFGTDAAREYLVASGIGIVDGDPREHADAVLVTHTDVVDFAGLERGARAILDGARLLTGSYVPAYAGANVAGQCSPQRSRRSRAGGPWWSASPRAPRCGRSWSTSVCRHPSSS